MIITSAELMIISEIPKSCTEITRGGKTWSAAATRVGFAARLHTKNRRGRRSVFQSVVQKQRQQKSSSLLLQTPEELSLSLKERKRWMNGGSGGDHKREGEKVEDRQRSSVCLFHCLLGLLLLFHTTVLQQQQSKTRFHFSCYFFHSASSTRYLQRERGREFALHFHCGGSHWSVHYLMKRMNEAKEEEQKEEEWVSEWKSVVLMPFVYASAVDDHHHHSWRLLLWRRWAHTMVGQLGR